MKTYLITIDRSSREFEILANTEKEANEIVMTSMANRYKTDKDEYDFWVAECQQVT